MNRPNSSKPSYIDWLQKWLSAGCAVVVAFLVAPFIVGWVLPYAVAFADAHYGVGFVMPLTVWALTLSTVTLSVAHILKLIFSRETLRFLLPSR